VEIVVVLVFLPAVAVQPMQTNTVSLQFLQSSLTNPAGASVESQILHLMLSSSSQAAVLYSKNCAGAAVCFCGEGTIAVSSGTGVAGVCADVVFLLAALSFLADVLTATLSAAGFACAFF
jgi:hypothetical protein